MDTVSAPSPPPSSGQAASGDTGDGGDRGSGGPAVDFTYDADDLARRRASRARRLHTLQIPTLRALGFLILSLIVALHGGEGGAPTLPTLPLIAGSMGYALLSWWLLVVGHGRTGRIDLGMVMFHVDLLVWLLILHQLEPLNPFFAYLLLVRVVDQVGFGFRRAVYFAHVVTLLYLGYAALAAVAGVSTVDGPQRLTIAGVIYVLGWYLSATGLLIEQLRNRTRQAVRAGRAMTRNLDRQARDLEAQAQALGIARAQAEAASRAKSQFLAITSHEIRTPMNGILGASQLLMGTPLSSTQRHYVDTLHRSASALLALMDDVLDLSRIEAGRLGLSPQDVDVRAIVQETIDLIRVAASDQPLAIDCSVDAELPPRLQVDPTRLRQMLLNLLHNAVKFTECGHVRLDVAMRARRGETADVRFIVHDTGIGIAPDALPSVWDAFTQVDGSTTRRRGGTGLGLSIVRDLARRMGGETGADSRVGVGSSFWVDLPLAVSAPEADVETEPPSVPGGQGDAGDGAVSVLVVDDDPTNVLVIEGMLTAMGCRVVSACDGLQGLEAVAAASPAIAFMDCHMPVMDGYEATRRIRQAEDGLGRRLPIIALTADTLAENHERCLAAGMDEVLTKPVSPQQLATTIRRWTGNRLGAATQW